MWNTIHAQLILHEGLKTDLYKCPADKWTIGVGRNLEDVGLYSFEQEQILGRYGMTRAEVIELLRHRGITKGEALYMLDNDIDKCKTELSRYDWYNKLDPVRQKVILDMRFNLGLSGLLQFKKMIQAIEDGDYERASDEMKDSRWYHQVGTRSKRLVTMMRTGVDYIK